VSVWHDKLRFVRQCSRQEKSQPAGPMCKVMILKSFKAERIGFDAEPYKQWRLYAWLYIGSTS